MNTQLSSAPGMGAPEMGAPGMGGPEMGTHSGANQVVDLAPRTAAAMSELVLAHTLVHTVQDAAAFLRHSYTLALAASARELTLPSEQQNLDAVFVLLERSSAQFKDSCTFAMERLRDLRG